MKRALILIITLVLTFLTIKAQLTTSLACRRYTTQDGLPQMQTERLFQDQQGYIYIGTLSGFVRYDGRQFTPFLKGRRENIVGFAEVEGRVRALNFRRQWIIDGEEVTMQPVAPGTFNTEGYLPKDTKSSMLLNNLNSVDLPDGYVLLEDDYEKNRRLCRITKNGFDVISTDTLLDKMLPCHHLYIDSAEGLLIPSDTIYSFHRQGKHLYAFCEDGIYNADVMERVAAADWSETALGLIVRDLPSGNMVIADEHSLYVFDGISVKQMASGFNLIKDVMVDSWGRLWVATYQGLYCYFGQYFMNYLLEDKDDIVRAIGIGADGRKVMGTLNGKVLLDGQIVSDNPQLYYSPCAATVNGMVYMAAGGDVCSIDSTGRQQWLHLPTDRYTFVYADTTDNHLIISSKTAILSYQVDNGIIDTLTTHILHPWSVARDNAQQLWVGSTSGLFCLADTLQQVCFSNRRLYITALEGTPWGDVIFASNDSLYLIHHNVLTSLQAQIPQLSGHEVRSLHLSPRQFLVVAVIDGLFVCRINNDCTISDVRFFNHENGFTLLEPMMGKIVEEADGTIWMCGIEGMTSFRPGDLLAWGEEDTYIAPPLKWHERLWVRLAGLILFTLVVWLVSYAYIRHRSRKRMQHLMREKKQKELQISTIRLKSIPHFHANVLAAIEYFVMNNSTEEATHYLKLYSEYTGQTLRDIDKPAQTIDEEVNYVRKYLELQKLRYDDRLTYDVSVADDVDCRTLLPTMLLHTYVENAIKHGISPKPGGGHVSICISSSDNGTKIMVEDNGVGWDKAQELSAGNTKMGLRILSEQINLYNKTNSCPIIQEMSSREGLTRFMITIPKGYKYD